MVGSVKIYGSHKCLECWALDYYYCKPPTTSLVLLLLPILETSVHNYYFPVWRGVEYVFICNVIVCRVVLSTSDFQSTDLCFLHCQHQPCLYLLNVKQLNKNCWGLGQAFNIFFLLQMHVIFYFILWLFLPICHSNA